MSNPTTIIVVENGSKVTEMLKKQFGDNVLIIKEQDQQDKKDRKKPSEVDRKDAFFHAMQTSSKHIVWVSPNGLKDKRCCFHKEHGCRNVAICPMKIVDALTEKRMPCTRCWGKNVPSQKTKKD
tara:strand:+ start:4587 stop:4958 length:372 start_codon:yes stop_codon:yes gene_type:complete